MPQPCDLYRSTPFPRSPPDPGASPGITCSMPSLNLKGLPRSLDESHWAPSGSCRYAEGVAGSGRVTIPGAAMAAVGRKPLSIGGARGGTYIGRVVDGDCVALLRVVDAVPSRKDLHLHLPMLSTRGQSRLETQGPSSSNGHERPPSPSHRHGTSANRRSSPNTRSCTHQGHSWESGRTREGDRQRGPGRRPLRLTSERGAKSNARRACLLLEGARRRLTLGVWEVLGFEVATRHSATQLPVSWWFVSGYGPVVNFFLSRSLRRPSRLFTT
jgi:hypothetical protein